jgi:hypothetical protein
VRSFPLFLFPIFRCSVFHSLQFLPFWFCLVRLRGEGKSPFDFKHVFLEGIVKFESLDTTYVNLGALIRYLRERNFVGRVHVELDQYEADVSLDGSESPTVRESDDAAGGEMQGDASLARLLVRAGGPGGLITVYERHEERADDKIAANFALGKPAAQHLSAEIEAAAGEPSAEDLDWDDLLRASGALIAAVERAVQTTGEDFATYLRLMRLELGDDYPFLDPTLGGFEYSNSAVRLSEQPAAGAYISSLSECLRRIINKVAAAKKATLFRERLAVELAVAARRQANAFAQFTPQLDRIAGTRVL